MITLNVPLTVAHIAANNKYGNYFGIVNWEEALNLLYICMVIGFCGTFIFFCIRKRIITYQFKHKLHKKIMSYMLHGGFFCFAVTLTIIAIFPSVYIFDVL